MTDLCAGCPYRARAEDAIATYAVELRQLCAENGRHVAPAPPTDVGLVDESVAAWLVDRAVGTVRNWRMQHSPLPYRVKGRRVRYALVDIARYMLEGEQK